MSAECICWDEDRWEQCRAHDEENRLLCASHGLTSAAVPERDSQGRWTGWFA